MTKWEYKNHTLLHAITTADLEYINMWFGRYGWELVSMVFYPTAIGGRTEMVFKRPIEEK